MMGYLDYPVHFWMNWTLQGDLLYAFGAGLAGCRLPVAEGEVSMGHNNALKHLQLIRGM